MNSKGKRYSGYMSMCLYIGRLWSRHLVIVITISVRPYYFRLVHPQFGFGVHGTLAFSLSMLCLNNYIFPSQLFLVWFFFNILHGHALCMHESHVCNAYFNAPQPKNVLLWDIYASGYGNHLFRKQKLVLLTPTVIHNHYSAQGTSRALCDRSS